MKRTIPFPRRGLSRLRFAALAGALALVAAPAAGATTLEAPDMVVFDGAKDAAFERSTAVNLKGRIEGGRLLVDAADKPLNGPTDKIKFNGAGLPAIFVDVAASFADDDPGNGPGLFIRYGEGPAGTSAIVLMRTPTGYLMRAMANGATTSSISGSLPTPADLDHPVRLAARETTTGTEFFVDGQRVATLSADAGGGHALGLLAFGTGRFAYDNYGVNRESRIEPLAKAPAPAAPVKPPVAARIAETATRTPSLQVKPTTPGPRAEPARKPVLPASPPAPQAPEPAPTGLADPNPAPVAVWIEERGQPAGPFGEAALRERIAAGTLMPQTLAWTKGMGGWQPAIGVPPVQALFSAQPMPPPDPASAGALDPASFLVGDWTSESEDTLDGLGPSTIRLRIRYDRNGSATAAGTIEPRGAAALPTQLAGNWSATPAGPNRFTFTYSGSMAVSFDANSPPTVQPVQETSTVEILDRDTIRTASGILQRRVR